MGITTRETSAVGVTNKGSILTNAEVDENFIFLLNNLPSLATVSTDGLMSATDKVNISTLSVADSLTTVSGDFNVTGTFSAANFTGTPTNHLLNFSLGIF